jgi:LmbE family N-acetylglucosaminyl deacetylase
MRSLEICRPSKRLSVLCLGAHSDDIEIGIGGTLLQWLSEGAELDVVWCVLSAAGSRKSEARASAADFLAGAKRSLIESHAFRDGYFPSQSADMKTYFEEMKTRVEPNVIFTHWRDDAHQDHRETAKDRYAEGLFAHKLMRK